MIAYYFRFINDKKRPTGWIGCAVARDKVELFWEIDRHGDPYRCVIQRARSFSWCAKVHPHSLRYSQHEITDELDVLDPTGWRRPRWPREVYGHHRVWQGISEGAQA